MYFPLKKNNKNCTNRTKAPSTKQVSVIVQGIINEITPNFKTRLQYNCYHNNRCIRFYVLNTGVNIHAHASFPMFLPNSVTQWVRAFILLVLRICNPDYILD